ncbi:EAL and HDOD domain-containing protein [Desulfurispira natronophila]|uniref:EAL and modified HD-GYP domain-containing signal transduction protein n=1 Tax=Desulfurispira natronophila TaxID=682562 RepID=A0A7W8DG26_9BACT|nr:EAL domain-containing protein [Desulfurispira natronophila]MBB5020778.1 EAL and modified HD-GYP domain-containing signal transduction protein [Desulfurispira natronophila]
MTTFSHQLPAPEHQIYIGRQPILDASNQIVAYELFFRHNHSNMTIYEDSVQASARTLVNLLMNIGMNKLIGDKLGFVNIDDRFLMTEAIESLPRERIVFEILDHSMISDQMVARVQDLAIKGYRFALDNVTFEREYLSRFKNLIDKVEFVKIDISQIHPQRLMQMAEMYRQIYATLVVEKVEQRWQADLCRRLEFPLFQGYFFAVPEVVEGHSREPSKITVIQLIQMLSDDQISADSIARELKVHPELSVNLLRYINSGAFYMRSDIRSLEHAITLIGRTRLMSWLLLICYADPHHGGLRGPLLESAIFRAKLMEEVAATIYGTHSEKKEQAFFAGMLSLVDVIFRIPLEEILQSIHPSAIVKKALLHRTGSLGKILSLAEVMERTTTDQAADHLSSLGVSAEQMEKLRLNAYEFVQGLLANIEQ